MRRMMFWGVLSAAFIMLAGVAHANGRGPTLHAHLSGLEEVPALSTTGEGSFRAKIDERSGMITYSLEYGQLVAPIQQAHLHLGQRSVNGGIMVFLCTNLGNGPAGTQLCPAAPAEITGTIMADDVLGPAGQGVTAGEFDALLTAIRAGVVYVNVHTQQFPGGEIRGQLR